MKKLFVLAIATLFAFSMSAQKFGVKAGMNMSGYKVNFWSPDGAAMGMGMNFAVLGEMPINDLISIRADLGLNQLGSDYDSRNDADDFDWGMAFMGIERAEKTNVNYLKLGLTPKFSFGPAYAFVGPYFAYAINGKKNASFITADKTQTASFDIFSDPNTSFDITKEYNDTNNEGGKGDLYNKLDLGLNLGFGANFSGVFVELNAGLGMMNFINTESTLYNTTPSTSFLNMDKTGLEADATQKNLFFGLSVGYMLGGE